MESSRLGEYDGKLRNVVASVLTELWFLISLVEVIYEENNTQSALFYSMPQLSSLVGIETDSTKVN